MYIIPKNAKTYAVYFILQNVGSENNNGRMAPLSCNAGIQALAKRAHRVGQHLSWNFSH